MALNRTLAAPCILGVGDRPLHGGSIVATGFSQELFQGAPSPAVVARASSAIRPRMRWGYEDQSRAR